MRPVLVQKGLSVSSQSPYLLMNPPRPLAPAVPLCKQAVCQRQELPRLREPGHIRGPLPRHDSHKQKRRRSLAGVLRFGVEGSDQFSLERPLGPRGGPKYWRCCCCCARGLLNSQSKKFGPLL